MKKMALDTNAAAMDVGLDTLNMFIAQADNATSYELLFYSEKKWKQTFFLNLIEFEIPSFLD